MEEALASLYLQATELASNTEGTLSEVAGSRRREEQALLLRAGQAKEKLDQLVAMLSVNRLGSEWSTQALRSRLAPLASDSDAAGIEGEEQQRLFHRFANSCVVLDKFSRTEKIKQGVEDHFVVCEVFVPDCGAFDGLQETAVAARLSGVGASAMGGAFLRFQASYNEVVDQVRCQHIAFGPERFSPRERHFCADLGPSVFAATWGTQIARAGVGDVCCFEAQQVEELRRLLPSYAGLSERSLVLLLVECTSAEDLPDAGEWGSLPFKFTQE